MPREPSAPSPAKPGACPRGPLRAESRGLAAPSPAARVKGREHSAAGEGAARHHRRRISVGHRIEGWGAAMCFGAFGLLPLDWASAIGGALARTIGPRLGISKRARRNIRRALPELADHEIAKTIAQMWDNLG